MNKGTENERMESDVLFDEDGLQYIGQGWPLRRSWPLSVGPFVEVGPLEENLREYSSIY